MAENSAIEWTDHTFNPWEGCQRVGPGCDHCYAETRNARFNGGTPANWGPGAPRRRTSAANWRNPFAWNAAADRFAAEHGRRQRVFCASLADVFDKAVPVEWRADLLELIDRTPNLDWLLLTKRIGNVSAMVTELGRKTLPPHVWLGATIVNQAEADRDIPKLLAAPAAAVRFLSMEPLLGPVDLRLHRADGIAFDPICDDCEERHEGRCEDDIDWVIVGGESGAGARPMHPDWARGLRDQCAAAGVPFLFKQWGEWAPSRFGSERKLITVEPGGRSQSSVGVVYGDDALMARLGKKRSGRLLDGIPHDGVPA